MSSFIRPISFFISLVALALLSIAGPIYASATGDPRHPGSPAFPAVCSVDDADLYIVNGEPSSETAFDTDRVQSALNACAPGKAVELASSGGNRSAFLIQPIHIPNGVTLQIDGGVTVFASRNPEDYQRPGTLYPNPGWTRYRCGSVAPVGTNPNGCYSLFVSGPSLLGGPTSGSGIIGYGVIDGRGGDELVDANGNPRANPYPSSCAYFTWWCLTNVAYGSGSLSQTGTENNPILINPLYASNFTLFQISLIRSPYFFVRWQGYPSGDATSGLTAWGVKIRGPYYVPNTDGIDPSDNVNNVTIKDSYISTGDDDIAISADEAGHPVTGISISNVYTFAGDGVTIGTGLEGGVNNVLVDGLYQNGDPGQQAPGQAGIKIKSNGNVGGIVSNITYENVCMQNETRDIDLDPNNGSSGGSHPSTFGTESEPITFHNVTIATDSSGNAGLLQLQGTSGHPSYVNLNNVNIGEYPVIQDWLPAEYVTIGLGPGPVTPHAEAFNLQALSGTDVHYTGAAGSGTAYACSTWSYPQLVGQLYLTTGNRIGSETNLQALRVTSGTPFTLNSVLEPTVYKSPAPTVHPVYFYEGSTLVGKASLSSNGTLAGLVITNASAGTHTYTAEYPGDTNYRLYKFGSVTVTVTE